MFLLSYNKRPISVLLPSSTLPAVMNRNKSIFYLYGLEISIFFTIFHCGLRKFVVDSRLTPFAGFGGINFPNDLIDRYRVRFYRCRAGHVSDRPVPHLLFYYFIRIIQANKRRDGDELPIMLYDF